MNSLKLLAVAFLGVTTTVFSITSTGIRTRIGTEQVRDYETGTTVTVPFNKQFKVMFDEKPGTGYRWYLSSDSKKLRGLDLLEEKALPVITRYEIGAKMPGVAHSRSGGSSQLRVFTFKAGRIPTVGRHQEIKFELKRSWEKEVADKATILYKVRRK